MSNLPPQSIESEVAVLGSLLIDRDAIVLVADQLQPGDFYRHQHGVIYAAMLELFARREPIDVVTVSEALEKRGNLDQVGGSAYLTSLINLTPSAVTVEHYAHIVAEKGQLRDLIGVAAQISAIAHEDGPAALALDRAGQLLFALSRRDPGKWEQLGELAVKVYDRLDESQKNRGQLTGAPTGFPSIDGLLGGLQRSELIILAARTSVGKTTLALQFAEHAALSGRAVGVFSLEMSAEQLVQRLLAQHGKVDSSRMRDATLRAEDFTALHQAVEAYQGIGVHIDDSGTLSPIQLRTKARRLHAEHGLDLLVIDYLQLMHAPTNQRDRNRVQEVSEISRQLKALSRELEVPVLALSQLSRKVEERPGSGEPQLSDLRESGSIEQDADVVMFLWKPRKAKKAGAAEVDEEDGFQEFESPVSFKVAKHRNGPTGGGSLIFQSGWTRFIERPLQEATW